jgi:hypothetical protein
MATAPSARHRDTAACDHPKHLEHDVVLVLAKVDEHRLCEEPGDACVSASATLAVVALSTSRLVVWLCVRPCVLETPSAPPPPPTERTTEGRGAAARSLEGRPPLAVRRPPGI